MVCAYKGLFFMTLPREAQCGKHLFTGIFSVQEKRKVDESVVS